MSTGRRRTGVRRILLIAAALALTCGACADRDVVRDSGASTTPPPATGSSPAEAPSTPSDLQPVDLVAGLVVRGGAGPCYGVEDDDGRLYAVYSPSAGTLARGTPVLVKTAPPPADMDCGEGVPVTGVRVDVVP